MCGQDLFSASPPKGWLPRACTGDWRGRDLGRYQQKDQWTKDADGLQLDQARSRDGPLGASAQQ